MIATIIWHDQDRTQAVLRSNVAGVSLRCQMIAAGTGLEHALTTGATLRWKTLTKGVSVSVIPLEVLAHGNCDDAPGSSPLDRIAGEPQSPPQWTERGHVVMLHARRAAKAPVPGSDRTTG